MVQQGSFSLERGVGRRVQATLGYVFNLDRQLPGSTDLNVAASTGNGIFQLQGGTGKPGVRDGEVFAVPVYTARVNPAFGPVTDVVSHTNATYHSLVAALDSGAWAGVRGAGELHVVEGDRPGADDVGGAADQRSVRPVFPTGMTRGFRS